VITFAMVVIVLALVVCNKNIKAGFKSMSLPQGVKVVP
jgi:hypothetical protein